MAHIIIRNVGPIKEVEFDLNKINVFIFKAVAKAPLPRLSVIAHGTRRMLFSHPN